MNKPSDQNPEADARDGGADGSLGEQLRRARIARGVSLREISDQTRITMRHLEAIEADDYKHLPGGIFNRSFVRAFARCVNFDEKRALELYTRSARDHGADVDEPLTSPQRSRIYTDGDTGRSPIFTFGISALLLAILCLGIYALWYAYERRFGSSGGETATPRVAADQKSAQPSPAAQTPAEEALAGPLRIQVKARDKGFWLTAVQDDGKQTGGILKPSEPRDFAPERSLRLRVGRSDAANLEVVINGRAASLPADTGAGDAEWNITKENYRTFLP